MKFIPTNGKLLVRQYKKEDKKTTASGIIMPDSMVDDTEDRIVSGMVIKAASDASIPEGADIWVENHLIHGIKLDGTPYIIVQEGDIDGWQSETVAEN